MYETNLSDAYWEIIKKSISQVARKRKYDMRVIFDALFYLLKRGCHWRMLPADFPKWQIVYYYFSKWRDEEAFVHINDRLREKMRTENEREAQCSAVIIDSQSVKTTLRGGLRGIDGNKRIKGRKRHIAVDTMGNLVTGIIHTANIHDSNGATLVVKEMKENTHGITHIIADSGYRGKFIHWAKEKYNCTVQIISKLKTESLRKVSPKRWIVERTFSWLENVRRLSKDFEYLLESSQAMLYLASIKSILNKI